MGSIIVGKRIVIAIIAIILFSSISIIVLNLVIYLIEGEYSAFSKQLVQGLIRSTLEAILFVYLYKGKKWAKIIVVVLFLIAGILSLINALTILSSFSFVFLLFALLYITSAILLLANKSVNVFLNINSYL